MIFKAAIRNSWHDPKTFDRTAAKLADVTLLGISH